MNTRAAAVVYRSLYRKTHLMPMAGGGIAGPDAWKPGGHDRPRGGRFARGIKVSVKPHDKAHEDATDPQNEW
jgi:hypothetical protein